MIGVQAFPETTAGDIDEFWREFAVNWSRVFGGDINESQIKWVFLEGLNSFLEQIDPSSAQNPHRDFMKLQLSLSLRGISNDILAEMFLVMFVPFCKLHKQRFGQPS